MGLREATLKFAPFATVTIILGHLALAIFGIPWFVTITFYAVKPFLSSFSATTYALRDVPLVLPFFPLQSCAALLAGLGFAIRNSEFGTHWSARAVWVVPTIWLLANMSGWSSLHSNLGVWEAFFLGNNWGTKKMQLTTTLPCMSAVFYGLGNYLGLLIARSRNGS